MDAPPSSLPEPRLRPRPVLMCTLCALPSAAIARTSSVSFICRRQVRCGAGNSRVSAARGRGGAQHQRGAAFPRQAGAQSEVSDRSPPAGPNGRLRALVLHFSRARRATCPYRCIAASRRQPSFSKSRVVHLNLVGATACHLTGFCCGKVSATSTANILAPPATNRSPTCALFS